MADHEEGAPADFKKSRRQKAALTDPTKLDRLPPHSVEAEQGVLGCILLSPDDCLDHCIEKFTDGPDVFYDLRHRTIYEALISMKEQRLGIDTITVQQELKDKDQLHAIGGLAYLAALPDCVPSAANLDYYIPIVREKFVLRRLIGVCTEIAGRAYEHQGEVEEMLDQVERDIHRIVDGSQQQIEFKQAKELVRAAIDRIEYLHQRKGEIDGLSTGLIDLDRLTGGLRRGEMFVIAARPSVGKTSLAMGIAEHVAVDLKLPVGVFSLEMSAGSLMIRMLCSRARVSSHNVRDGRLMDRDFTKLAGATEQVGKAQLSIEDSASLTILQLRAKARRMHHQHKIRLLIVDYLQLLSAPTKKSDNRQQEVSDISKGLKQLARELSIPVVVLSQLNRDVEKGARKPRLSDLRESGSIEQDADGVGLLHRVNSSDDQEQSDSEAIDLILAKQRNGPTGLIHLNFLRSYTRFEAMAREEPQI